QLELRGTDFRAATGRGVKATVDGSEILVGAPNMLRELDLTTPGMLDEQIGTWTQRGAGILHVVRDGQIIGALAVGDKVRPESRAAVRALQDRGVMAEMIRGGDTTGEVGGGRDLG